MIKIGAYSHVSVSTSADEVEGSGAVEHKVGDEHALVGAEGAAGALERPA